MPETAEHPPDVRDAAHGDGDGHGRRRLLVALLALVALAAVVVVLVAALSGGSESPPSTGAAKLVPANTLVFLNLSTDESREGTKRALALANRLPSFGAVSQALARRLGTRAGPVDFRRDIRPWLGDEAALAVLPTAGPVSQSELVFSVSDRDKAEQFITRSAGGAGTVEYRGTQIRRYGAVATAFVGDDLVIAPEPVVRGAIDRFKGRAPSLAGNGQFKRAYAGLPAGRALDAYVSRDGVRRLLAPQGGVLGLAGTLLDQPALAAVGLAVGAQGDQARLTAHSVLDPALAKAAPRTFRPFSPSLLSAVPSGALAYLGVAGVDRAAGRLLGLAGATGVNGAGVAALAQRARATLGRRPGVNLDRDVLSVLKQEAALVILPGLPTPTLAVVAKTPNEARTRLALARLQVPLAQLVTVPATGAGEAPTFQNRQVAGVDAFQLRLTPAIELDYAVFDGKLVVATSLSGIARIKQHKQSLADDAAFQSVLGNRPSTVTSLVFLDFGQLLALGERTGLGQDPAYQAVRNDLQRVRAVGTASTAGKDQSTAEITIALK